MEVFYDMNVLKISQNLLENTFATVSTLTQLPAEARNFLH